MHKLDRFEIKRARQGYYTMEFMGKTYRAKRKRPLLRRLANYRLKQELGL